MADWYYAANGQQVGPVDEQTLRQMVQSGSVSAADLVFGPGLSQWTAAGQVPALSGGGSTPPPYQASGGMIDYRGMQTDSLGISSAAMMSLRQTGPWVRFIAVMLFIIGGLTIFGGVAVMITGSLIRGRAGPPDVPVGLFGLVYFVLGGVYLILGNYLNSYASGIAAAIRNQRMSDLERAFAAQKSFWRVMGIIIITAIALYMVVIVVAVGFAISRH